MKQLIVRPADILVFYDKHFPVDPETPADETPDALNLITRRQHIPPMWNRSSPGRMTEGSE